MTAGAHCETSYENGTDGPQHGSGTRSRASPAALGFRLTVDGARFDLAPLDLGNAKVAEHLSSPGWRSLAFAAAVREDTPARRHRQHIPAGLADARLPDRVRAGRAGRHPAPEQVHASLAGGRWSDATAARSCGSCTATIPTRHSRLTTARGGTDRAQQERGRPGLHRRARAAALGR